MERRQIGRTVNISRGLYNNPTILRCTHSRDENDQDDVFFFIERNADISHKTQPGVELSRKHTDSTQKPPSSGLQLLYPTQGMEEERRDCLEKSLHCKIFSACSLYFLLSLFLPPSTITKILDQPAQIRKKKRIIHDILGQRKRFKGPDTWIFILNSCHRYICQLMTWKFIITFFIPSTVFENTSIAAFIRNIWRFILIKVLRIAFSISSIVVGFFSCALTWTFRSMKMEKFLLFFDCFLKKLEYFFWKIGRCIEIPSKCLGLLGNEREMLKIWKKKSQKMLCESSRNESRIFPVLAINNWRVSMEKWEREYYIHRRMQLHM